MPHRERWRANPASATELPLPRLLRLISALRCSGARDGKPPAPMSQFCPAMCTSLDQEAKMWQS